MSDALRPSSLFNSPAPATAPSGVLATLPNPPPEISQLPAGTTIRGTVVGHDDRGHLLVRTDLGTLAVSTKANPPPGSDVVLQIRSSGAQLHVLLMLSDLVTGGGQRVAPAAQSGGNAPAPDRLTLGQSVQATVQAPAAGGAVAAAIATGGAVDPAVLASLARLAPGSQITVRIVAVAPPAQAPGLPAVGPLPSIPPGAAPMAGTALPTAGSPAAPGGPPPTAGQTAPNPPSSPSPALVQPSSSASTPVMSGPSTPGAQVGGALSASPPAGPATGAPATGTAATSQTTPSGSGASAAQPSATIGTPPPGPGAAQGQSHLPAQPDAAAAPPGPHPAGPAGGAAYKVAANSRLPGAVGPVIAGGAQSAGAPAPYAATASGAIIAAPPITGANHTGPRLTGVVTTPPSAGQPVLQTPIGTLTLGVRAALAVGSQVIFDVEPGSLPRVAAGTPFQSEELQRLPASLARAWPALEEAIRVLHDSQAAQPIATGGATVIPQPGPRLASGLLFFLAALNGGDAGHWLGGQAAQALGDAGRGDLLTRLGHDFGQLSRQVDSGGTDWRLFLIPIHDGHQVQQIRFFERHGSHQRRPDGERDGEATRFVLEVELSRLGDMQIDGLVRDRRFDLILRTRRPMPDTMRHRIAEIFSDANDGAGYTGSIGFQSSRDWRFMPVAGNTATPASAGLVI